jgi:transcriptional regulator with XRE-family HTH domain
MSTLPDPLEADLPEAESGALERYLGNAIRDLRQRHGLTIAEVADRAGISRGMLSKIENAQTATSLDSLHRLAQALGGLFAVAENYPDLKANQNMLAVQEELTSTENRIGFARQAYNDAVMRFNTAIEMFPSSIVAGATSVTRKPKCPAASMSCVHEAPRRGRAPSTSLTASSLTSIPRARRAIARLAATQVYCVRWRTGTTDTRPRAYGMSSPLAHHEEHGHARRERAPGPGRDAAGRCRLVARRGLRAGSIGSRRGGRFTTTICLRMMARA